MKTLTEFLLDESEVPVNNAGDGNIASIGVGPQGEPGVKKKKRKETYIGRRNPPS